MQTPAYYLMEINEVEDSLTGEVIELPYGERLYSVVSYKGTQCSMDLVDIEDALKNIVRGRSFEVVTIDYSTIQVN